MSNCNAVSTREKLGEVFRLQLTQNKSHTPTAAHCIMVFTN